MGPKQAMELDLAGATQKQLVDAEKALFRLMMKSRSNSPIQNAATAKYWEVRKQLGWKRANPGKTKTGWIPAHAVRIRKVRGQTLVDIMK